MLTLRMPGGSVTGWSGLGRADRVVEHAQHAAEPGDGGLRLIEHLGELGDGLEESVRQEDEPDQRTRCQSGVGTANQADGHDRRHRQHAEHLARREEVCADRVGADERVGTLMAGLLGHLGVVRTGAVRTQRLRARHHLADSGVHVGVALPRLVVGRDEVALNASNTIASGAAVAKATSASTQSYASITPATITINVPSSSHARAPHEKNCDRVSMSLVTRATSDPFRSSPWSARLSLWMCSNSRTRSP